MDATTTALAGAVYLILTILVTRAAAQRALNADTNTSDEYMALGGVCLLWPVAALALLLGFLIIKLARWRRA